MSNSKADDYFSFMSAKGKSKNVTPLRSVAPPAKSARQSDTIDFVEEPQIEVNETSISDTMIERIFGNRFKIAANE